MQILESDVGFGQAQLFTLVDAGRAAHTELQRWHQAQQARRLIRERILEIFGEYDFILIPAAPTTAWRFGEKSDDPVAMYLSDIYTVLANLAGIPALALPVGTHPENGLPVGVQLMAAPWQEERLLDFAGKNAG